MYSKRVRIMLVLVVLCSWVSVAGYRFFISGGFRNLYSSKPSRQEEMGFFAIGESLGGIKEAYRLLTARRDIEALRIFEEILSQDSTNIQALWGKAEVLRRGRRFKEAESILIGNLESDPEHPPSLLTLAYIRYKDNDLSQAQKLIGRALGSPQLSRQDKGIAYMLKGAINSRRSKSGWIFGKLIYGTQIKGYFLKARELAPQLPEVHLGLGTFYLLAPKIAGGDRKRAIEELRLAIDIAPDFATASARLAQAYKEEGSLEKYNYYVQRARRLDPQNEVLQGKE